MNGSLTEQLLDEWFADRGAAGWFACSPATTTRSCFNGLLIEQMFI
jgi:hypothetical protein